jgi:hypothetical protein
VREVLAEIAQRRLMDTTAAVTWTALVRIHHPRTGPLCTLHLCACTCAHRTVYPLLVSFVMGMHRCRWDMGHITLAIGPRASCMAATRARISYPPAARSRQQIPRAVALGGVGLSAHHIRHGTTTWGRGGGLTAAAGGPGHQRRLSFSFPVRVASGSGSGSGGVCVPCPRPRPPATSLG